MPPITTGAELRSNPNVQTMVDADKRRIKLNENCAFRVTFLRTMGIFALPMSFLNEKVEAIALRMCCIVGFSFTS